MKRLYKSWLIAISIGVATAYKMPSNLLFLNHEIIARVAIGVYVSAFIIGVISILYLAYDEIEQFLNK